ncbi:mucin-2-like isoform X2 [Anneissia japonica]|uniref:mucin-2-like isoform X2 n=1 Tax=Anneissia japonica TaxID=1529436 RepID=UPI001425618B|nr:mucin-2-like isoform X2 [Anneissia japonica]
MAYRILICWFLLSACLATSINGGRVRRKSYIPDLNGVCWSPWFSDDNTSHFTSTDLEIETISVLQIVFPNQTCDVPSDIQCRTVDTHISYNDTLENVICIMEYGLQCRQIRDVMCSDYEIRIACPCNINNDAVTDVYVTVESTKEANQTVKSSTVKSSSVESLVSEESFSEFSSSDFDYAATGFHETIAGGVTSQENTTSQTTVTIMQPIMTKYEQSTSTPLVTLPESGEDKCWSPWLDDERLGISTDSSRVETERISTFRRYDATLACAEPERIQCRKIVDKIPAGDEVSRCDVTFGLQCIDNKDNDCADYEIRLLCPLPCHPNGTLFTITSPAPPVQLYTTTQHRSEEPVPTVDEGTTLTPGNIQATTMIGQSQSSVPYESKTSHVYTQNSEPDTANPPVEETTIGYETSEVSARRTMDAGQSSSNMPDGITTESPEMNTSQRTVMKTTGSSRPKTQSSNPTMSTESLTTDLEQGFGDATLSVTNADTSTPNMDITEKNTIGIPLHTTTDSIIKRTTPVDTMISTSLLSTELPLTISSTLPTTTEDPNVISRTVEALTSSRMDVSPDVHTTIKNTYKATNLFTTESYTTAKETLAITNTQMSTSIGDLKTIDSTTNPSDLTTLLVSKPTEHSLATNTIGRTATQPEKTEELASTIELTSSTLLESNTVTELHPLIGCRYSIDANLTWRRVEINKERSSQEMCPEGTPRAGMPKGTRYCGSDDDGNAMWMPPVINDCLRSITTTSKTTEQREEELVNLSEATVTMDNVTEVADELTLLTDGVDEISENMFNAIADTLDNIVNVGSTSLEVTEAVFSAVSNLLSTDMGNADVASSSTKIVKAVDTQVALAQQGQGL